MSGVLAHGGRARPIVGRWVVLHQIAMQGGGPVDSIRSGPGGRWRMRVPGVDSLAVYVVSAFQDGIAYFSQPIRVVAGATATADTLVVYDTTTAGPAMRLRRRVVTVAKPGPDGSRDVLEIIELENPGRATRVAPDTLVPTWSGAIPEAALQFQVGTGDFSAEAVRQSGSRVLLFGPVQPHVTPQLTYGYVLPGTVRSLVIPIDQPTVELDLLLEETESVVGAPTLHAEGVERIENRAFSRYRTDSLAAGAPVTIAFPSGRFRVESIVPVLVVVIGVVLGVGLWVALRRPASASGP